MDRFLGYLFWLILVACVIAPPIWFFYHGLWVLGIISVVGAVIPTVLLAAALSAIPDLSKIRR